MFKSVRNILEQRIFHLYKFSKIHIILIYFIFAIDKIIVAFSLIFDQRTLSFLDNIHAGIKSRTNTKILRSWSAKQRSCTELPQKQRLSHSLWKDGKIDSSRQGLALRASAWAKSSIRVRYINAKAQSPHIFFKRLAIAGICTKSFHWLFVKSLA